jgi:hypothetical protein
MAGAFLLMLLQATASAIPPATDYVRYGVIVPEHGAASGDRRVLYRSGDFTRAEWTLYGDRTGSAYEDLARGVSIDVSRDRGGVVTTVTIRRTPGQPRVGQRQATSRRDRALG